MSQRNLSKVGLADRIDDLEDDLATLDGGADGRLDDLEAAVDTFTSAQLVYPALTVGAQAGAVIGVTVQIKDINGDSISAATSLLCQLFDSEMAASLAADFTMAESGAGAEVSTTAKPSLLITTSATGAATVSVTDVQGASGSTVYLVVTPLNSFGHPEFATLAFAGA